MTSSASAASSRPDESLRVAALLSAAGGFLDAFTWLAHGGVFANAQTGNVVLLGLFAALGQWAQAARHVPPIAAFVLGVFVAHRLRIHGSRQGLYRIALVSIALEVALLAVVAVLPARTPDLPITIGIAFVAAMQSSCFPRVEGWAYSSVMTTGNLRHMTEAMFAGITAPRDPTALRQAGVFATICAAFTLGTALGGFITARFGNAALLAPILLLAAALALCLRTRADASSS